MTEPRSRRPWTATAVVAACVVASIALVPWLASSVDLRALGRSGATYGALGFVAVVVLWSLTTMPSIPLMVVAGVLFGPWLGALWSLVGSMIGVSVTFLVGRWLGAARFEALARRHAVIARAGQLAEVRPIAVVTLLRMAPVFPVSALNYGLGATAMRFSTYFWVSLVLTAPGAAVYAGLGDLALRWWHREPAAASTVALVVLAAVVSIAIGSWHASQRGASYSTGYTGPTTARSAPGSTSNE